MDQIIVNSCEIKDGVANAVFFVENRRRRGAAPVGRFAAEASNNLFRSPKSPTCWIAAVSAAEEERLTRSSQSTQSFKDFFVFVVVKISFADFIRDPDCFLAASQIISTSLVKAASSRRTPRACVIANCSLLIDN